MKRSLRQVDPSVTLGTRSNPGNADMGAIIWVRIDAILEALELTEIRVCK